MAPNYQRLLESFRFNDQLSTLKNDKEKKAFLELQKYNLLRLTSERKMIITPEGEKAISIGVGKYIKTLKFERELIREAPKLKRERNILSILVILLLLSLIFVLFFDLNETLLGTL